MPPKRAAFTLGDAETLKDELIGWFESVPDCANVATLEHAVDLVCAALHKGPSPEGDMDQLRCILDEIDLLINEDIPADVVALLEKYQLVVRRKYLLERKQHLEVEASLRSAHSTPRSRSRDVSPSVSAKPSPRASPGVSPRGSRRGSSSPAAAATSSRRASQMTFIPPIVAERGKSGWSGVDAPDIGRGESLFDRMRRQGVIRDENEPDDDDDAPSGAASAPAPAADSTPARRESQGAAVSARRESSVTAQAVRRSSKAPRRESSADPPAASAEEAPAELGESLFDRMRKRGVDYDAESPPESPPAAAAEPEPEKGESLFDRMRKRGVDYDAASPTAPEPEPSGTGGAGSVEGGRDEEAFYGALAAAMDA